MFFQHVYDKTLAQASYLIGCQAKGEAIVIDPKRDVDTYLQIAAQNNLKITKVTETHIHADFLSGARELAALSGAQLYLSEEGGPDWHYAFPHLGLRHGDVITLGNLSLEVLHTPGHTPESLSFLLTDHPASSEPVMLFTGDFVFVGDVGRPDLLEKAAGQIGTQEKGAAQLFASLQHFMRLPAHIQVWPGHGAGSACGKALGAVPSTTVGYEKLRNWALQFGEEEAAFTKELLEGQPEAPRYFATMKTLNKIDRPLLTEVPRLKKFSKEEFLPLYRSGTVVIDARAKGDFARGYLPGSLNIQGNTSFATWMGWVMDYSSPFVLVGREEQIEDLTRMLMRIGMDQVLGYVDGVEGMGVELAQAQVVDFERFTARVREPEVQVLDVRSENEFRSGHVAGAQHLFVGTLGENLDRLDPKRPVLLHCQGGDRAALAYSLLKKAGFAQVENFSAGMNRLVQEGFPLER